MNQRGQMVEWESRSVSSKSSADSLEELMRQNLLEFKVDSELYRTLSGLAPQEMLLQTFRNFPVELHCGKFPPLTFC